jgi:hypothetical protein
MKRKLKKNRMVVGMISKLPESFFQVVNNERIPVYTIDISSSTMTEKKAEEQALWCFSGYDMRDIKRGLYVERRRDKWYVIYGCYNFKFYENEKISEKHEIYQSSFKYDIVKIKYDDSFLKILEEEEIKRRSYKHSYDPGPKGDRLNSMNRTWYEND